MDRINNINVEKIIKELKKRAAGGIYDGGARNFDPEFFGSVVKSHADTILEENGVVGGRKGVSNIQDVDMIARIVEALKEYDEEIDALVAVRVAVEKEEADISLRNSLDAATNRRYTSNGYPKIATDLNMLFQYELRHHERSLRPNPSSRKRYLEALERLIQPEFINETLVGSGVEDGLEGLENIAEAEVRNEIEVQIAIFKSKVEHNIDAILSIEHDDELQRAKRKSNNELISQAVQRERRFLVLADDLFDELVSSIEKNKSDIKDELLNVDLVLKFLMKEYDRDMALGNIIKPAEPLAGEPGGLREFNLKEKINKVNAALKASNSDKRLKISNGCVRVGTTVTKAVSTAAMSVMSSVASGFSLMASSVSSLVSKVKGVNFSSKSNDDGVVKSRNNSRSSSTSSTVTFSEDISTPEILVPATQISSGEFVSTSDERSDGFFQQGTLTARDPRQILEKTERTELAMQENICDIDL